MNTKKNVHIAVVASPIHRLAQLVNLSNSLTDRYDCKFTFFFESPTQSQLMPVLSAGHDAYVRIPNKGFSKVSDLSAVPSQKHSIYTKIRKIVRLACEITFFGDLLAKRELKCLNNEFQSLLFILKDLNVNSVLLCGDRHVGIEPLFLKAAEELKILSVVPYMSIAAEKKSALILRKGSFWLTKKFVRRPEWGKIVANHPKLILDGYLYYQLSTIKALDNFGVLSKNPWQMGSGSSKVVCVDSEATKAEYIKNGVNHEKLKVVGDTSLDSLFEKLANKGPLKSKIFEKYRFKLGKKTVVLALPQLAEHGLISWDQHWSSIHQLLSSLSKFDLNVLVSLHPKMERAKYSFIESKYGFAVAEEQLQDVLPVADVFMAGFSSTVFWATLCGAPSIVMDYFSFGYNIFDGFTSISIVLNDKQLRLQLTHFLNNEVDFNNDWRLLSREKVFDGGVFGRYYQILAGEI